MANNEAMSIAEKDENESITSTNVIFKLALDKSINMKIIAAKKRVTVNSLYNEGVDYILEKYRELLG